MHNSVNSINPVNSGSDKEHQSTINENMPFRMLLYAAKSYEDITDKKDIYKRELLKIPRPEFIVFYNGKAKYPDRKTLRLSDAFIQSNGKGKELSSLELVVRVVNINKGHNASLLRRSESLAGYSEFVAKAREFEGQGFKFSDAIKKTVSYCLGKGILRDFLRKHSSEVISMLAATEFNMEDALAVRYAEGIEKGIEKGEARGIVKGRAEARSELFALWEKGVPLAEAKRKLKLGRG